MLFSLLSKPPVLHKALNFHPGTQRHNGMAPSPQHREPVLLLGSHPGKGAGKAESTNHRYSLSLLKKNPKTNRPRICRKTFSFNLTAVWQEGYTSPFWINLLKAFQPGRTQPRMVFVPRVSTQGKKSKMNNHGFLLVKADSENGSNPAFSYCLLQREGLYYGSKHRRTWAEHFWLKWSTFSNKNRNVSSLVTRPCRGASNWFKNLCSFMFSHMYLSRLERSWYWGGGKWICIKAFKSLHSHHHILPPPMSYLLEINTNKGHLSDLSEKLDPAKPLLDLMQCQLLPEANKINHVE